MLRALGAPEMRGDPREPVARRPAHHRRERVHVLARAALPQPASGRFQSRSAYSPIVSSSRNSESPPEWSRRRSKNDCVAARITLP
jgi:hypothetical protein